ncbi:MAG: amidohydrolase [Ruminococcaceae bacterium]|nr:amidohydrolase [Oscillospiraceae bacterium]
MSYEKLYNAVEKHKDMILEAERHIWKNPEPGYREWKTHAYLKERYEAFGYELCEAGDIPGFYTDIDTGKPGPTIAVFGEMDSLIIPSHPECDKETGAVHACGHHCQSAALLGLAAALKEPGVLEGLCGKIRLIAVPAEEGVEIDFRLGLKKDGIIKYMCGKPEFLHRGYLDGVDLAMMIHTSGGEGLSCPKGSNGALIKYATFTGKSAHAGGSPHKGINALYAATTALSAANALRETFQEKDTVRYHPIITKGGNVVNAIPDEVITESYLRAATVPAMKNESLKINRAFAGAAAAMGCGVRFTDVHGFAPRYNDPNLKAIFKEIGLDFFKEEEIRITDNWGTASSDMGDIACVIPCVHPYICGAQGASHGPEWMIVDPYTACVVSAKIQLGMIAKLLENGGEKAKYVLANKNVPYASKEEYFAAVDSLSFEGEGVIYNEDGTVTLKIEE